MKHKANLPRTILLIVIFMLLAACRTSQPMTTPMPPTATFTSVPPTATSMLAPTITPMPPTVTFTSVPPTTTSTPSSPTDTATSTFTPPPPLCEGVEGACLEIRFDEESCTHIGPEIVPAGEITLIYSNYGTRNIGIDLEILDEGKTWDNMSTYIGPSPSNRNQPSWSHDVATGGAIPGGNTTKHLELSVGRYISVCWRMNPHLVWLGGELIVE